MHRSLMGTLILSVLSITVSQIPISPPQSPCIPSQECGFTATRAIIYFQDFPIVGFVNLGLMFLIINMAGELKRELRRYNAEEEEISLAP